VRTYTGFSVIVPASLDVVIAADPSSLYFRDPPQPGEVVEAVWKGLMRFGAGGSREAIAEVEVR